MAFECLFHIIYSKHDFILLRFAESGNLLSMHLIFYNVSLKFFITCFQNKGQNVLKKTGT